MSILDVDDAFRAQVQPLVARLLHTGAHHPHLAIGPSRDLAEILYTRERVEYACWTIARACVIAGSSLGGSVKVVAGVDDGTGHLVEQDNIDDVEPSHRAAVRFMSCAAAADAATAHAVFLTVPTTDVPKVMRALLATTIHVFRVAGWGAH